MLTRCTERVWINLRFIAFFFSISLVTLVSLFRVLFPYIFATDLRMFWIYISQNMYIRERERETETDRKKEEMCMGNFSRYLEFYLKKKIPYVGPWEMWSLLAIQHAACLLWRYSSDNSEWALFPRLECHRIQSLQGMTFFRYYVVVIDFSWNLTLSHQPCSQDIRFDQNKNLFKISLK